MHLLYWHNLIEHIFTARIALSLFPNNNERLTRVDQRTRTSRSRFSPSFCKPFSFPSRGRVENPPIARWPGGPGSYTQVSVLTSSYGGRMPAYFMSKQTSVPVACAAINPAACHSAWLARLARIPNRHRKDFALPQIQLTMKFQAAVTRVIFWTMALIDQVFFGNWKMKKEKRNKHKRHSGTKAGVLEISAES